VLLVGSYASYKGAMWVTKNNLLVGFSFFMCFGKKEKEKERL
jgi:hypothetical protein